MELKPLTILALSFLLPQSAGATTDLEARYQAAVADAEIATAEEISRDLTAISSNNNQLIWQADNKALLVVTWTGWDGYDSQVGNTIQLSRDVWVTAAPQLQQFCQGQRSALNDNALTLRLEQLMGLPPHNGKSRFVELWVKPGDMFRPSPDPAITDHEAELDFPIATGMTISESHKAWITNLKATSYGPNGYPWTRLGYTYDWGQSKSHVGLSEFVVREGAQVQVREVQNLQAYCQTH